MSRRAALVCLLHLAAPVAIQVQTVLGSLLYADPVGRGIRLVVVDGGGSERMTLRAETGDEHRLRRLVLTFAGPERFQATEARALAERVPPAWRVPAVRRKPAPGRGRDLLALPPWSGPARAVPLRWQIVEPPERRAAREDVPALATLVYFFGFWIPTSATETAMASPMRRRVTRMSRPSLR